MDGNASPVQQTWRVGAGWVGGAAPEHTGGGGNGELLWEPTPKLLFLPLSHAAS